MHPAAIAAWFLAFANAFISCVVLLVDIRIVKFARSA